MKMLDLLKLLEETLVPSSLNWILDILFLII